MIERDHALVPAPSHDLSVRNAEPNHHKDHKDKAPPAAPPKRFALYVLGPVVAFIAWGGYGHWRTYAAAAATQQSTLNFVPQVRTARAQRDDKPVDLTLPGQTEPFDSANIYARATGYVAERRADIGSRVRKGELMLRIAAPDLDEQLVQAQAQLGQLEAARYQAVADLAQAQANTKLAGVTKYRETTLANQGWETQQNADNATANASVQKAGVQAAQAGIAVAVANIRSQQANIQRLQQLIGFEDVRAPFDGVVTARAADTGDLVSADANGGTPLLSVQREDVLRVAVYVPQAAAIGVHDGLEASVTVPELPGRIFRGRVSRNAVALNAASRSMLTEVDVENSDNVLHPGLYVDVHFAIPRRQPGVVVPDEALVFNAQGLNVAVVQQDSTVRLRKVSIYRDFGTSAELRDGLKGGEEVVLDLPVQVQDGSKVTVAEPRKRQQPNSGSGGAHNEQKVAEK